MILRIAARELKGLFLSPMAWSILAILQVIFAWVFLGYEVIFVLCFLKHI